MMRFQAWGFSPEFWKRQRKVVVVFALLTTAGVIVSRGLERKYHRDNPEDAEAIARETAQDLKSELRAAKTGTIAISKKPGNPPNTLLSFVKIDGTRVAYFEDMRSLYRERNDRVEKIIDGDLLAAYFAGSAGRRLFMEFQVWTMDQNGDLTIRTVPAYADVTGRIIQSSRHTSRKKRKAGVIKRW